MCLWKLKMCSKLIIISALLCICSIVCAKKLCHLDDNKCLLRISERKFEAFASGMPGVHSSDPLYLDSLEVNLPSLKYKLVNGTLTGMKHCHEEFVKMYEKDKKYDYHIGCPHLVFESKYEIKGKLGPEFIEGKGNCRVFYSDYHFLFNGDYEKKIRDDGKYHLHMKSSHLEIEAKGKVHYEFDNLFNGNKVKSEAVHKFANENWQYVDKLTREAVMDVFMKKYMNNVNEYFKEVSIDEMLSEE